MVTIGPSSGQEGVGIVQELSQELSQPLEDCIDTGPIMEVYWFLSATVVVNTVVYKTPQIYSIVSSGSSHGISLTSVLLEWIAYSIMLTYHYAMDYPFETFLDIGFMVFQATLLVLTILSNRQLLRWATLLYAAVYAGGMAAIAFNWLPKEMIIVAISLTTPILCWSKVDQFMEILGTQDPGNLSALSWFLAVYNTGVRILTTVMITKDMPMFINLTSSEALNIAIFTSIVYYNRMKVNKEANKQTHQE